MNEYIDNNDGTTILRITGNKNNGDILVSTSDVELLKEHSWYIKDKTSENQHNYVAAKINKKTIKIHRFILNITDKKIIIDHLDRNTFNNTRSNLVISNSKNNNLNTKFRETNTSGRTGVYYKKGQGNRSDSWVGQYNDANNKKHTKQFAIEIYGYDKAFKMACEFREYGEKIMNIKTDKTIND